MPAPSQDRLLTKKSYATLLRQIATLAEEAEEQTTTAKIESTWHIGRRISGAKLSHKAGYHNSVIRDLAEDLGLSKRSLQEAVTFSDAYDAPPSEPHLNWSHYRLLMRLSKKERAPLQKLAIKERWSVRKLSDALDEAGRPDQPHSAALPRPTDPTYLYSATITGIVDGDTIDVDIDLGFEVTRHARLRLSGIDAPRLETEKGRDARDYLTRSLHAARTIAIVTERIDLHGRYVVHLFSTRNDATTIDCFESGKYENAALVSAGHAVVKG
jgi:micrococcal nuclease